jgi:hypothetical protein
MLARKMLEALLVFDDSLHGIVKGLILTDGSGRANLGLAAFTL